MTEESTDNAVPPLRAISIAELARYLEAKGADRPCEACGSEKWEVQQPPGFMSTSIGLILESGAVRIPSPVLPTYAVACVNCGSVRSFLAYLVLKWLKANPT